MRRRWLRRKLGGLGLEDDEFYRRLVGIAGGLWSGRLSDWMEDRTLAIALGRSLLTGEESAARLESRALARIGRDIRMDAECRQVLRQARRLLRNPSRKSVAIPPRATWLAWTSAEASSFLVDARRTEIVRFLEDSLLLALCGHDWLTAEAQDRRRPDSLARQMAEGAVANGLALGPEFPQIAHEDQPLLLDALTQRFAHALESFKPPDRAPGPALTEDEAALLDAAVDAAYADLSASLELRGEPVLEENDAYSPADRWQRLSDRSWTLQAQSPFRHLILPESRWESLQATTYARLSDNDLVSLLTRCHMDISRTAGIDWVGPQVLRSGLLLWLAPNQLLETEAWRDHLARLLSDRHTARAIRYVALRLGRAERGAADRMIPHV